MRVIEARGRYAPQAKFTTWLYTIAHNRLVDHWRKKGLTLVALDEDRPGAGARQSGARRPRRARRSARFLRRSRRCRRRSARRSCCTRRAG